MHQNRRCNIVRQIRTDGNLPFPELFFQEFRQADLHNILPYYLNIREFPQSFLQHRCKPSVQFHGSHTLRFQRQLLCQNAEACSDLQNTALRKGNAVFRNCGADLRIGQKILSQPFGKGEVMPFYQFADHLHIG